MKALGFWLGFLAVTLLPVSAQVTVEVTQDQDQFLPSETLATAVRITNRSGRDLRLGQGEDWLTFSVQSRGDSVVARSGEVPVGGEFVLESSKVATKRVDLAPYFAINRPGRYTVTAFVRIKDWNQEITSQPRNFDIIDGAKLWEQEIGVPNADAPTNSSPEVRKYILQQANYLRSQLRLYVRLTDASGTKTFRVFPVGPMVSFSRPEPQVDKFSNLHLLYQDGAHSFNYTVVNPDGEVIARRTYDYVENRPRLQPDEGGKILVTGGVRRVSPTDVPPWKPATPGEEPPKPLPSPGEMIPLTR
jgi:hypothetical protein